MTLTRDAILNTPLPRTEVAIAELGGSVFVRALTAVELMETLTPSTSDMELVALLTVDAEGKQLFQATDAEKLANIPAKIIKQIASAALAWNGFGPAGEAEAKNA